MARGKKGSGKMGIHHLRNITGEIMLDILKGIGCIICNGEV
jgi:hypothetical protein